ncbi:MFS multidrug transporter [Penicillium hispanicum]|uniref:MFS multidrug transporter n=1 Tax=Penicillium hispanicum TaxID=1080232 RepID=UPI0025405C1D|nr:MFS multidrug transporter [Penicillium hispanicum]KAJ5591582.1 MFS multidrug transporter [Penicillium hispanicum]
MTASEPPSPMNARVPHDPNQERKEVASTSSNVLKEKTKDEPITAQNTSHTPEKHEWITGVKLAIIITAITLVTLLMLLDTSIVVTVSMPAFGLDIYGSLMTTQAIPRITSEFHSLPDIGWYGSAYQLARYVSPFRPMVAIETNNSAVHRSSHLPEDSTSILIPRRWTFMGFFAIFELGSLICAVATSSKMFIVGRAIAGIGTSGIINGAFTIIAGCVPMERRPSMLGIVMGISQLGLAAGPLIGGALTEYATWRWCFWINLPVGGLVAIMLCFLHVPEQITKPKFFTAIKSLPGKLDLVGFALFAPSAIQLLLALEYGGNQYAWHSSQVIGLFCGAGATFIVFLVWDYYQGDAAIIPFSIVRKRIVWSSCLTYGLLMGQMFCASYYLPIYFQGVRGATPTLSGVYILPSVLGQLFAALISGKLVERVGYYLPIIAGSAALMSVSNGLLSTLAPHTSTGKWIGYQILLGVARGLGLQMPIVAVQNAMPPPQIPIATALVVFSQTFAGALFLSLSDTIFTNSLKTLLPEYAPSVKPETVIDAGATGLRSQVSAAELANVVIAYAKSVDRVFYLTAGMATGCFFFSLAMGWKDIRKKAPVSQA